MKVFKPIFSVLSVPVQLSASPGFLTRSGCGCNTVSCTEIDCRVLRCQADELHIGCAGGFVYRECGLALELLSIVSITTYRINSSNPLQSLTRPLLHPVHSIVSEGVAWSLAGQLHGEPWFPYLSSRLQQLDLGFDTYRDKERVGIIVNSILFLIRILNFERLLPVATDIRKRIIQLQFMVRTLCVQWLFKRYWPYIVLACKHQCIYHSRL